MQSSQCERLEFVQITYVTLWTFFTLLIDPIFVKVMKNLIGKINAAGLPSTNMRTAAHVFSQSGRSSSSCLVLSNGSNNSDSPVIGAFKPTRESPKLADLTGN